MIDVVQNLHPVMQALLATSFTWAMTALGAATVFMSRLKSFWYGQLSGIVEPIAGVIGAAAVILAQPILPIRIGFCRRRHDLCRGRGGGAGVSAWRQY